jgi:hypothetical protein
METLMETQRQEMQTTMEILSAGILARKAAEHAYLVDSVRTILREDQANAGNGLSVDVIRMVIQDDFGMEDESFEPSFHDIELAVAELVNSNEVYSEPHYSLVL